MFNRRLLFNGGGGVVARPQLQGNALYFFEIF